MRASLITLLCGSLLTGGLLLGSAPADAAAPQPAMAMPGQGPGALLRDGIGKMMKYLKQPGQASETQTIAFLEREIVPYFDFGYMTQWVAGPAYVRMGTSERVKMEQELKDMFLSALAQHLAGYDNQQVRFMRPRHVGYNEVRVGISIQQPGNYPARMEFRFYLGNEGWKVFDVEANGSSALVHYRKHFRNLAMRQRAYPGGAPAPYRQR